MSKLQKHGVTFTICKDGVVRVGDTEPDDKEGNYETHRTIIFYYDTDKEAQSVIQTLVKVFDIIGEPIPSEEVG